MPLYRPSELSEFLASLHHHPKRTLSQNFLIDGNIVAKIVSEVNPSPDTLIVEIGPGPGVLTEAFLMAGSSVVAIEKDDVLANALHRLDPEGGKLSVIASDIMDCSFAEIIAHHTAASVILVSNLPYHLTTPIIQKLMEKPALFSRAVLMVQEEVARRLTGGKPSLVGCLAAFFSDVRYAFSVPKGCFWPKPKVDSAILTLYFRKPLLDDKEQELFFEILRMAFLHRRKTILHSLQEGYPREQLIAACDRAGVSYDSRPEEMSLNVWVDLFRGLIANP